MFFFIIFHLSYFQIEYLIKRLLVMATSNTSETVRVIVRCRPMNQREIDLKCQVSECLLSKTKRNYFSYVLDSYLNEYTNKSSDVRKH